LINEVGGFAVGVHEDAVCCAALSGVGGLGVAVAQVLVGGCVELECLEGAAVEADARGAGFWVNGDHLRARAILARLRAIIAGELDTVAFHQFDTVWRERLAFGGTPLSRSPVNALTVSFGKRNCIFGRINACDRHGLALGDAFIGIVTREPHNIADLIASGIAGVGASEASKFIVELVSNAALSAQSVQILVRCPT
jgi:hypothetical protein